MHLLRGSRFAPFAGVRRDGLGHKGRRSRPIASLSRGLESLEGRSLMACAMHMDHMDMGPVMMAEHHAVMDLVDPSRVTATAVNSGRWSDPRTWQAGAIPQDGANVYVPEGITVTVDRVEPAVLRTISDDGAIIFDPTKVTGLTVDTFVVTCCGLLQMGTADQPIAPGARASITFAGASPIDTAWDPNQLSRGLISQGTVRIHGADKTPYSAAGRVPTKGDTSITLAAAPANWTPGDRIVLTGTDAYANQDEVLTIRSVAGATVTLDRPLAYTHAAPAADLSVYVANLTRNVVLTTADPSHTWARGHVMFMHTDQGSVVNAALVGLGRTDKNRPLDNPVLDASGRVVPGTGLNPTGRYAIHVHRSGTDASVAPVRIEGSVVEGSPGWGFVNHSSNVDFERNVSYNVLGAGFASEAGDEIGTFDRNLAIRSVGSGMPLNRRADTDLGHQGVGFWFQSGGVALTDNIATGQALAGFFFWNQGLHEGALGVRRFPSANLPDPSWAKGKPTVTVGSVPIRAFSRNVVYASGQGVQWWFNLNLDNAPNPATPSVIDGLTVWNEKADVDHLVSGFQVFYARHMILKDVRVIGNLARPVGTAIGTNLQARDVTIVNPDLQGWQVGIAMQAGGTNRIQGGAITAVRGIEVVPSAAPLNIKMRTLVIDADVKFGTLSAAALGLKTQADIYLNPPAFAPATRDLTATFAPLMQVTYGGRALYQPQQAPGFVPFRAGASPVDLPPEFLGLTNQQLWDRYGLAVWGAVAPANATTVPRINALIGDSNYPATGGMATVTYVNNLAGYRLTYLDPQGVQVTEAAATPLKPGWNLLSRTLGGRLRTFLVYGDVTPPTFAVDPALPMSVRLADLDRDFVVRGTFTDNSAGSSAMNLVFSKLRSLPILTRADGSRYIVLTRRVIDRAWNGLDLRFELTVTA